MAVGQGALVSGFSYVALSKEATFGTYATCTSAIEFNSFKMTTTKERKILEQVSLKRFQAKSIGLGKKTEGEIEFYFVPDLTSSGLIIQNAFGGSLTTATVTAATSFTHTYAVGNMDASCPSLSINCRYGDSSAAKIFNYAGVRVNELGFKAEIDDALICTAGLITLSATNTGTDVSSALTVSTANPLSFVGGRVSVEGTLASLTSSTFWHVQSVEYKHSNNLKADNDCRRIGSDELQAIVLGQASAELTVTLRFDTLTAYNAMMAQTQFAAEFEFTGETIAASTLPKSLKLQFPKVFIKSAPEPEIGGPDEVLKTTVVFDVMRDDSSAGGYAVQAILTNGLTGM